MLEQSCNQDVSQTTGPAKNRRQVPRKGERIQLRLPRMGIYPRGTVQHVDDLQILVKWDDGRSGSLRGALRDHFRILEGPGDEPHILAR
jgi:hypothetical protein